MIFAVSPITVKAQCAGSDNSVTVCEKDTDPATRAFTLFDKLGGSPTTGGTWSTLNPENFFVLNQITGVVDLWQINNFGPHQFTYTNASCGESATVTINLGGFPGEDNIDGSANACGDDFNVNLHQFLGSNVDGKVQDFNGLWEEVPANTTGFLVDNIFDAASAGPGVYTFTYTVDAVDTCLERTSTVILEVHPPANPGTPIPFEVCADEDLSIYTNVDLRNLLIGESPNGTWAEAGTNQLSDLNDSVIDVQDIFTNFGYGEYIFTYTVFPSHPVCEVRYSEVVISILPILTGTLDVPDFCASETSVASITYDDTIFQNGNYTISYSVNGGTTSTTPENSVRLNNGTGTFEINNAIPINQLATLEVIGISHETRSLCSRIAVASTTFLISNPQVGVTEECIMVAPTASFNTILNSTGTLLEGSHTVTYQLTDPSGTILPASNLDVDSTSGAANFEIPANELASAGAYNINFEIANSFDINCELETTFTIQPAPDAIDLDLLVDNSCNTTSIQVAVDAPILPNGGYSITYEVVELDTGIAINSTSINFNGGTATYDIDLSTLTQGNYFARITSGQNDTTQCRTEFNFEITENFSIDGIPPPPEAVPTQTFCVADFFPSLPTLQDLQVAANGELLFYATETDGDILPISTPLVDGEDYFVSNIDPANSCEASERIAITTLLSGPDTPSAVDPMPIFCVTAAATLEDIVLSVTDGASIVWYDSFTGTNSVPTNTILVDGTSYFAEAILDNSCPSIDRLEIVPIVVTLDAPDLQAETLRLCGLDNPTVQELIDLENTMPFEVRWYTEEEGGTILDNTIVLESGMYYAESYDPVFECTNPSRIPVTVDLSDCRPEDYNFFVPDAFSPNGDGRNDTFFIPNIEVIFPDFTLEIFNRYGRSLFKGNSAKPQWNGEVGSNTAPNGVYFYVIEYNKEGFEPLQGRLYLNR